MVEVKFEIHGDHGESPSFARIGYFDGEKEAKQALRGLCPWDFSPSRATSDFRDFIFEEHPGTLAEGDTMIKQNREARIRRARSHVKSDWAARGRRAPDDWE